MTASPVLIKPYGEGYAVWRDGERLTGALTWTQASAKRAYLNKLDRFAQSTRPRKCMCCDTIFASEGPHHRLCNYHRTTIGGFDRQMAG